MKGTIVNIKTTVITVVYKNDIQILLKNIKSPVSLGQEIAFCEENVISGYMEKLKYSMKSIFEYCLPMLQSKNKFEDEIFAEFILDGTSYLKFYMNSKGNICNIQALNKKSEYKCRFLKVLEGQSLYKALMFLIMIAKKSGIKLDTRKAALTLITYKDDESSIVFFEKRIMKMIKDLNQNNNVQAVFFKFRKEEDKTKDISLVRYWVWKNIKKQECIEYIKETSFTELTRDFEDFERVPGFKSVV